MRFKVVNFRPERISGWCFDPENLRVKGLIDLWVDQQVPATFPCHIFRQELSQDDFPDRNIGFFGGLPPKFWTGDTHRATLIERHSGAVLGEKDLKTTDARIPGAPGVFAEVRLGESGEIGGWAGQGDQKLRVTLIVDGSTVQSAVADARTHRWSTKSLKVTGPMGWAFSLQVPAEYFDGNEHRIQVLAQTQPEPTVLLDTQRVLAQEDAGVAQHQAHTMKKETPENFPLAGWRAAPGWVNRWTFNGPVNSVAQQGSGAMVVENRKADAVYLFQNAAREDLRHLRAGHGAPLGQNQAFTVALGANTSDKQPQVFIMQFDTHGIGLTKNLIAADRQGLFVTDPQAAHLVIGIRFPGHGRYVVDSLEFLPVAEVRSAEPGIYPTEVFPAVEEGFPEIEDLPEEPDLEERLVTTLTTLLSAQAAELAEMRSTLHELSQRSAATESAIDDLARHAAQQKLQTAFGNRFTPEGGDHDRRA